MIVPVTQRQIEAAGKIHASVEQWAITDEALSRLRNAMPGWDEAESLAKSVAVNTLYSTQVFAIQRMAKHVSLELSKTPRAHNLVERLANLGGKRLHLSFASKLCHLFVDSNRYPIYDSFALATLRSHLGNEYRDRQGYQAYCENFAHLRTASSLHATTREIDQYLWIAGLCDRWVRERERHSDRPPRVNRELAAVLAKPSPVQAKELKALLPESIWVRWDHEMRRSSNERL